MMVSTEKRKHDLQKGILTADQPWTLEEVLRGLGMDRTELDRVAEYRPTNKWVIGLSKYKEILLRLRSCVHTYVLFKPREETPLVFTEHLILFKQNSESLLTHIASAITCICLFNTN